MLPLRPVLLRPTLTPLTRPVLLLRAASTSTAGAAPASSTAGAAQNSLDWDAFLQLRRQRRHFNVAGSIVTATIGTVAGVSYLANKEIDMTQMIFGVDPVIMFGLATFGCGAAGWLAGPSLGGVFFKVVNKRWIAQIAEVRSSPGGGGGGGRMGG